MLIVYHQSSGDSYVAFEPTQIKSATGNRGTFDATDPDIRIYAGYFFIANGQTTPNPEGVRAFAFNLKTKYAYFAKIQFTMPAPEQMTREEFAEAVADLAAELLPELMLCLPDWSEIESESAAPAA